MARADLMCELIKYGLLNDNLNFRKAAEVRQEIARRYRPMRMARQRLPV